MHYNDQGADFKYLIVNERDKRFGLSVTTVGFQAIRAGSVYPPRNHPDAYYFTAQKGRVLHEYQLVYITKGRGTFASDTTPSLSNPNGHIAAWTRHFGPLPKDKSSKEPPPRLP